MPYDFCRENSVGYKQIFPLMATHEENDRTEL